MHTQLGRIAALSQTVVEETSPLQRQVNKAPQLLALVAAALGVPAFALAHPAPALTPPRPRGSPVRVVGARVHWPCGEAGIRGWPIREPPPSWPGTSKKVASAASCLAPSTSARRNSTSW